MAAVSTLALIAKDAYEDLGRGDVLGYRRLQSKTFAQINSRTSSFFGAAYVCGSTGVVAYRGSQELTDWVDADVDIALGKLPIGQLGDAFAFFNEARASLKQSGCSRILVTGHSLGGGLAQLVAGRVTSFPTVGVTFNAPGAARLQGVVKVDCKNAGNVFNYRAKLDPVSLKGAHIGHPPVPVDGGGAHPLGPLIEALLATGLGARRV